MYRDILIDCHVIPALLARIRPDTPVRFYLENVIRKTAAIKVFPPVIKKALTAFELRNLRTNVKYFFGEGNCGIGLSDKLKLYRAVIFQKILQGKLFKDCNEKMIKKKKNFGQLLFVTDILSSLMAKINFSLLFRSA